jgi:hypothetical protein
MWSYDAMSTKTQKLIIEFGRSGYPLGRAIRTEEVPGLIQALRQRLGCTAEELDLSPTSLPLLEKRLIDLHGAVEAGQTQLTDEETVRLVREIAAYVGEMIVVNLGGTWDERFNNLWASTVDLALPVTTIKGGEVHTSSRRGFVAADNAAYFWDLIGTGRERRFLSKEYKAMTQKVWREKL